MTMTGVNPTRERTTTVEVAERVDQLRDLAEARNTYAELLGWQVTIDVRPGRLVLLTGPVADAVTMPARLGRLVLGDLRVAMLAGPVATDESGEWWMFFTAPTRGTATTPTEELADELRGLAVEPVPTGTYVVVPTTFGDAGPVRWVERPRRSRNLPPLSAVVATARRNGPRLVPR